MAKLQRQVGTTSQILEIFVQDSSQTDGRGLTGLVFNSASLACYYKRNTATGSTSVTLATITTLGTWATGGFKEVDSTNMPGVYEFDPPNAALASGADSVVFILRGATNMAPVLVEIELTGTNNQDATRGGMSALPNGAMSVKRNASLVFPFPMFDPTGAPKTGLTVTANRSLDGASFASCANSVTELSNGWYVITLAAADTNGVGVALRFSASGAQDTDYTIITQA